jgi:hypothetical protein
VTWEEVERALKKKDAGQLVFEAKQVVARVEKTGDLFAPLLELKQRLPDLKNARGIRGCRNSARNLNRGSGGRGSRKDFSPGCEKDPEAGGMRRRRVKRKV